MEIDIYDNDFIKSKHFFESNERMHETVIKSPEAAVDNNTGSLYTLARNDNDFIKEEAECGIR